MNYRGLPPDPRHYEFARRCTDFYPNADRDDRMVFVVCGVLLAGIVLALSMGWL